MRDIKEVVIVDGCRTAVGSIGGTLKNVPADKLAEVCIRGLIDRTGIKPEVMMSLLALSSESPRPIR